jgi:hypothetical protein
MSPDQKRILELENKVATLERFVESLKTVATVDPQVSQTILGIIGSLGLDNLSDVSLSSPSNGQVLKFNGSSWVNGTDNT